MLFDLVIVGAGLVGSSLALALRGTGLTAAVVEPRAPPALPRDESWDVRVYAISPGSAAFLDAGGAWGGLDPGRICPVTAMEVSGDDGRSRLHFSAYEAGIPELAFILESRHLQATIWEALKAREDVEIFCPARCEALEVGPETASIRLEDGRTLQARLVVGADGADSWVRVQAGIAASPKPYGQMGVVANFTASVPPGGVARQWFRDDGVLALLPLPDDRVSMVWSAWDEKARELLALEPGALCSAVEEASQGAPGKLAPLTPPAAFPLRLLRPETCIGPRLALIGDAAHNVHPLAGQGVNLGFGDARELAAILRGRGVQPDCGHRSLLRRYERSRREDVLAMQFTTDGLQKLFSNRYPGLRELRNWGLGLTDRLGPVKNFLTRTALG